MPAAPQPELTIHVEPGVGPVERDWLASRVAAALPEIAAPIASVALRVVGDATMAALHGRHCGDPTTTDVLAFPDRGDDGRIVADIVLCADEAARQARTRGHLPRQELALYAIHALLHCAGLDDHDEAGWVAMHAEEDRILAAIGVGAVFARAATGPGPDAADGSGR